MKKMFITLFITALFFNNTNAQTKSGILQKDYYGKFTANQWEGFLAGSDAKVFEEKATVKLKTYLVDVNDFVKKQLNEKDITSAMDNSIKKAFPADADVYTARSDGSWITRKAYPGEEGFYHVPTGTYWLSFECGNLCNFKAAKALPPTPGTLTGGGNPTPGATPNNAGINISINGQQAGQDISWNTGGAIFMAGMNQRQSDIIVDAQIFKMMQDSKQCCGQQAAVAAVPAQQQVAVLPAAYTTTQQPQTVLVQNQQKVPFGQTFGGQVLANTIGEVAGEGLSRVIYGTNQRRIVYSGYYGNTNWNGFGNNGTLFQDSNQLTVLNNGGGNGGSSFSNGW